MKKKVKLRLFKSSYFNLTFLFLSQNQNYFHSYFPLNINKKKVAKIISDIVMSTQRVPVNIYNYILL